MKCIYLLISLFISTNVFAIGCNSTTYRYPYDIEVSLPFKNQAADNGAYDDGICFRYNLNKNSGKKIICTLSNFNKGWMLYPVNNVMQDSFTKTAFTGNVTVILTSENNAGSNSQNNNEFHLDEDGVIVFHHEKNYDLPKKVATISCSYVSGK